MAISRSSDLRRVRRDLAVDAGRGKADARAGMLQDVAELGAVQLGIGRHGGEPGVPDAVEQFEIVGRILGGDGDAVAGRKPEPLAQRAGQPRGARGKFAVGRNDARARCRRRQRRMTETGAIKPEREVHAIIPSFRDGAKRRTRNPDSSARLMDSGFAG